MIIVLLDYVVPTEAIDEHRPAHLAWLHEGIAAGMLMAAGRQVLLTGGMLLCRGQLDVVKAWAATDPFALHGLAEYSFTEVAPSVVAPGLEALKE
ncbi:GTP cyclohydrolase [Sphingomonas sp. Leaf339]|uniref:YciI family protein n=1 Tax=Sphingomonas sp. Leaf339 TaxID=1736343 RepID=UPI0006F6F820|nr:YciI family protein [Sphingomonas sp. Leaf339]KQU48227.1 GTP cyclohydrolase [Sphingomonas sp. Leaf339]